jgi:hypothetical protein
VLADTDGPEAQVLFDDDIISVFVFTKNLEAIKEQKGAPAHINRGESS